MRLETVREPAHHAQKCPTCGGEVHRRAYGEMHAGSFISNGERVDIRRTPKAGFCNPIILDEIIQYFKGKLYRVLPADGYYRYSGLLHRKVWEAAFGPIPKGCHIHHRDEIKAHNNIENLECLPSKLHSALSWKLDAAKGRIHRFGNLAHKRAAEWHRSEAGKLWHKRHAERTSGYAVWKHEDRPCKECGKIFSCLIRRNGKQQLYCSERCRTKAYNARRAEKRKIIIQSRSCIGCGACFQTNGYGKQRNFCSKVCMQRSSNKKRPTTLAGRRRLVLDRQRSRALVDAGQRSDNS